MMQATCSRCNAKPSVTDDSGGRKRRCPQCGAVVEVLSSVASPEGPGRVPPEAAEERRLPLASGTDEREEIPLADEPVETKTKPVLRPAPPPANGLVMVPMQDLVLVDFQHARILDAPVIEAIGRELYALVDQQARTKIILDFAKVQFLSSQMLGVIITLHKKSAAIKGRVVLCGLRPELLKIFTIMKIDKLMRIVGTERDAMTAVGFRGGR